MGGAATGNGSGLDALGRALIGVGLALALAGVLLLALGRLTGGRGLPGDLSWGRGNVRVFFPLGTMLLLSLLLSLALNLLARWRR